MRNLAQRPALFLLLAALPLAAPASLAAQPQADGAASIDVYGQPPADLSSLPAGPDLEGFISARKGNQVMVTDASGTSAQVALADATQVIASGGFLGLDRDKLSADALLTGLPVSVKTVEWGGGLVATRVKFKNSDLKTATMIRSGTSQRFADQGAMIAANSGAIKQNTAATEALRGRLGDIDQYNIKGTTNVYFSSGKWDLSPAAQSQLCAAAEQAQGMDNALLLVVGYTDSTGSPEVNQALSEKRAGRVVNYLQQACGWKPYRMLTPTGMATADPAASNATPEGKAQNRRVAVNILVSKGLDGL